MRGCNKIRGRLARMHPLFCKVAARFPQRFPPKSPSSATFNPLKIFGAAEVPTGCANRKKERYEKFYLNGPILLLKSGQSTQ